MKTNKFRAQQIKERDIKIKIIKDFRAFGMTMDEIAEALGLTRPRIFKLCREKRLKRDFSNIIKSVFKKYGFKK